MPPRYLVYLIVVFWVWSMGGLMTNEVIPRLLPGDPPPFSIDPTDEAQQASIRWTITADGADRAGGSATTGVQYLEQEDLYRLYEELRFWHVRPGKDSNAFPDIEIHSSNVVTLEGDLRGIAMSAKMTTAGLTFRASFLGNIEKSQMHSVVKIEFLSEVNGREEPGDREPLVIKLNPVPVPRNANVLNPLQPVNRIPKLTLGQRWSVPSLNMIMDAILKSIGGTSAPIDLPSLQAFVQNEFRPLEYGQDKKLMECFVIDYYNGGDLMARTWVRETDRLVLRQEVHGDLALFNCTALILTRD